MPYLKMGNVIISLKSFNNTQYFQLITSLRDLGVFEYVLS